MTVYDSGMDSKWRIEQLSHWVAKALQNGQYEGQESARVREVPDVRTIRYYTTLGLVDRPLEMQGRTAFYGRRHLLQLVAIKRLQAQGLSLVEVQQALVGANDAKLEQLAALGTGIIAEAGIEESTPPAAGQDCPAYMLGASRDNAKSDESADSRPAARSFWAQTPQRTKPSGETPETAVALTLAAVLRVEPGISLLLDGVAPEQLTPETIAALAPAVKLLRETLQRTLGNVPTTKPDPTQETPE